MNDRKALVGLLAESRKLAALEASARKHPGYSLHHVLSIRERRGAVLRRVEELRHGR